MNHNLSHDFDSESQDDGWIGSTADLRQVAGEPVLLGESPAARRLRLQVERIAPYFRTALIRGDTGTGKELVARAIHALSPGADGPFVISSATALAEKFAVDETSASPNTRTAAVVLDSTQHGTLYLEGVGDLPFALQAGLLRFLRASEERRHSLPQPIRNDFRQLDNHRRESDWAYAARPAMERSDVRILAASNRDLRALSAIGQFRQDLYAQLSVVEVFVPPLRQRIADIPVIAAWLLNQMAHRTGQIPKRLADASLAHLQGRLWQNNLSELERVLSQAAALAEGPTIEPRHLLTLVEPSGISSVAQHPKIERLDDVIQQHVIEVLTRCGGNKLRAAELLGISRSTLYRMLDCAPGRSSRE